jgi:manganese efflux pump family protein
MRPMLILFPAAGPPVPGLTHSRALGVAALIAWLVTAGMGAYMARAWIAGGGLRRRRAGGDELPPAVVLAHASLAVTGLLVWASYQAVGWTVLAWSAVALMAAAIGLGISTVTLLTPYPVRQPAGPGTAEASPPGPGPGRDPGPGHVPPRFPAHGADAGEGQAFEITDEMIAALLTSPPPPPAWWRSRLNLAALIPVVHGVGAITTFLLAVLTAIGAM